ncbi:MAG: pentapeptide repeat-containing protein [Nitrososphaeraceae archaeon]
MSQIEIARELQISIASISSDIAYLGNQIKEDIKEYLKEPTIKVKVEYSGSKILEIDQDLWKFLNQEKDIIFKINNWEIYRRAAESTKPDLIANVPAASTAQLSELISQKLSELLKDGNVMEFNKIREQNKNVDVNILSSYIRNLDLSGINLSRIKFRNAGFYDTNLSRANLRRTKLFQADLERVNFSNADLSGTDLTGSVLHESIFDNAILQGTDITSVKYLPIRISDAQRRGSVYNIFPPTYSQE